MLNHITRMTGALAIAAFMLSGAARADTITVTHWGAEFYGAPYAVAMEKGFFKAHGVDITGILTSTGGGTSVRNTLAGDLPFGEVSTAAAVLAINAGQPLKIIGAGVRSVGDIGWIAKIGSPLHGVKALAGKRVAFTSPGSVTNMLILMALRDAGMTAKDVTLVPAGGVGANLAAVVNGAVDTAMTGEPIWTENTDKVQPVFWVRDVMDPHMMQTVLVTTTEFAHDHPDVLRNILLARAEGVRFIADHLDEAATITATAYSGDPALYKRVFRTLEDVGYWSSGKLEYPIMDRMVDGLRIVGQLNGPVNWPKYVDPSFLPPDQQAAR